VRTAILTASAGYGIICSRARVAVMLLLDTLTSMRSNLSESTVHALMSLRMYRSRVLRWSYEAPLFKPASMAAQPLTRMFEDVETSDVYCVCTSMAYKGEARIQTHSIVVPYMFVWV
jgi:hypothetical protein